MTEPCSTRIDRFVKGDLVPLLKANGFSKKKLIWNRRGAGGFIDVVEVQPSRWNDSASCTVTINLGLFVPAVHEVCWGTAVSAGLVRESDCTVRTRLGALLQSSVPRPDQFDRWWNVDDDSASEIVNALSTVALPYFEGLQSLDAIRGELEREVSAGAAQPATILYLGVVKALLGDREGSEAVLSAFGDSKLRAWSERVQEVSRRLRVAEAR